MRIASVVAGGLTGLALLSCVPSVAQTMSPVIEGEVKGDKSFELAMDSYRQGDFRNAFTWWLLASQQGSVEADYWLGRMYARGEGVKQDYAEAAVWYGQAADKGYAEAQTALAVLYENGQGVRKDYDMAALLYRKAAEQGQAAAQNGLGAMYAKGRGVPRDYVMAVSWYRKAAEQGNNRGQYNLGDAYHAGRGVDKDEVEAYRWLSLAVISSRAADDAPAIALATSTRAEAAGRLTQAQITDADAWVAAWKPVVQPSP